MTVEDEAVVVLYGWSEEVSVAYAAVKGSEVCLNRSVHIDESVDAVVVVKCGPVKMPAVFVAVNVAFSAAWMTTRRLE